jgi:hypothetical protein
VARRPFADLSAFDLTQTLARRLIPTADLMRDLNVRFGMRPYSVRVIRTRWTGVERGLGQEVITSELILLPTPRIVDLSTLAIIVQQVGADELGAIQLDEISGRFTEDQLNGNHDDGAPPDPDEQVYYEIQFPQPDGVNPQGVRRRFSPASAPHYTAGKFEWVLRLERARPDRDQAGNPVF